MLSWPRCVWGSEQRFFTIPAFLVTTLRQGSDVRRRPHAQTISCPLQGQGCLPPQTRGDPDLLRITLAAAMKNLLPIQRLPRSPSHPCPEPYERAQPLQFESLNARNARRTAITGIDTAAVGPTGGVPQPAPFPIAKTAGVSHSMFALKAAPLGEFMAPGMWLGGGKGNVSQDLRGIVQSQQFSL